MLTTTLARAPIPGNAPVTLETFSKSLGFESVDTFDLYGNPTVRMDLHQPVSRSWRAKYDWIIDAGTMFCCFDIGAVWRNIITMLKVGGYIAHISSFTGHIGRGYYSFQPSLFTDLYTQNGFEIITLGVRTKPSLTRASDSRLRVERLWRRLRKVQRKMTNQFVTEKDQSDWQLFAPNRTFLKWADKYRVEFAEEVTMPEPDMLPNNSLIMCFAQKLENRPFRAALPSFYSPQDRRDTM